jgi:hypothetical protein
MSRLRKFWALSPGERSCLLEAVLWLGLARLAILVLPFRRLAPFLGRHMAQSPADAGAAPAEMLDRLSWALAAASRHLPWECKCLAQALAGKAMLQRRGLPSTLYLGLAKGGEAGLRAHAWLRCGERILTGRQGMAGFTVIASFAGEGS